MTDMVSPASLRLPKVMAEKVRMIAALEQRSFAGMVRVLTEEAIKMREFPEIVFVDGSTGRRATFRGRPPYAGWSPKPSDSSTGGTWWTQCC
jgi:hypothetical protein